ncbi:MAG: nucleotidyltransferase domain-containing protein [Bellilinea sp.]
MLQNNPPEMTAKDVIEIVQLFSQHHIDICIDGGWGVDALLGAQTRPHADLDIAMPHKDVALARRLLGESGFVDMPRGDTRECNFVMGDDRGRLIDIHTYTFDERGHLTFGVPYPIDSLHGSGSVNGYPVKCITPEWMVKFHTGYPLDDNDYRDVKALCQRFGIAIPVEYEEFTGKDAVDNPNN